MAARFCQGTYGGNWVNISDRYLGLKFRVHGKTHFGWARLSVSWGYVRPHPRFIVNLTGYAYETIPRKSIKAGHTHGKVDDPRNDDFGPGASVTSPIERREPATLGALAMGAPGLSIWRRKEAVGGAQ